MALDVSVAHDQSRYKLVQAQDQHRYKLVFTAHDCFACNLRVDHLCPYWSEELRLRLRLKELLV